jgi:hypothetical protein
MVPPPTPGFVYSITRFSQDILRRLLSKSTVFNFSGENREKQLVSREDLR